MTFEQRLEPVYQDLVRYARGLAGSASAGDDLLQDALVKALGGYRRLRDPERFEAWLFRIVGNTFRSQERRRKLLRWVALDRAASVPGPSGLDFEEKDLVRRALLGVAVPQREALVLFEVVGRSLEEIATIQQVSLSAVKSRLARGREQLRRCYERLDR